MPSLILNSFIAAAMVVTAAPALAGETQPTTALKYDAKTQKYCLTDPAVTGTHLQRKTCKSATQWSADGLDMPKTTMAETTVQSTTVMVAQK
ncbi:MULTISPECIES: hypothetical protein [unclassified Sphingomonas]|jgi:hypothetical protein|uniref:hypothetical protein n=1 Tax=unclassified Sphingomonas TaxID=196159 RepID=UPI0006F4E8E2|nr:MULTISPECIES: hypothetical protein [unclassified Sphingomonas]KQN27194.1 hypothetical protein ASF00_12645 [Sphingomonas sp. Leaf34]KQN31018.1 hypothetical protein ASE88_05200 [Sphingomonas sp. Leaf38]